MRYILLAASVVLALAAAGCDLVTSGGTSYAGIVVDADTGDPVEGIQMSLKVGGGGFGSYSIVAETLTDAAGRFQLRAPDNDRASGQAALFVNSPGYIGDQPSPYNPSYTSGPVNYSPGNRRNIQVELRHASN